MIDILLSTYNSEKYLPVQLDSLIAQKENGWRVLWRDDGSTDKTADIYENYAARDKRFVVAAKGYNVGVMHSFELLLGMSNAEYIMFCDHDDVWQPDKISNTLEEMHNAESKYSKETPLLVFGDLKVTDCNLNVIDESFWHYAGIAPEYITCFATLAGANCVTGCTMMINQAAKRVSLPFGRHAMMHDHVIALQVVANGGHLVKNNHVDILYRQHGDNVVGATRNRAGAELVWFRLTHIPAIIKQNMAFVLQARDIMPLGLLEFVKNKMEYKSRRNG